MPTAKRLWRAAVLLAAASTSLRRGAAWNSRSGSRSCLVSSLDPCRRLYTRARANQKWPRFLAIQPSIQNAVASGEPSLLPARSLRMRQEPYDWPRVGHFVGGVARDCRGCRHGPVRAVRPRLDPGGGHRGAVEETGGLTAVRCSCGAAAKQRYGVGSTPNSRS